MRVYCDNINKETDKNYIDEWFKTDGDVDDFIFFKEKEKISEK